MDKICAASAINCSIHLEKALRSNQPGRIIECINSMGGKLKRWSGESQVTIPISNMFDMVLGEDTLFADSILLRLGDAFVLGDDCVRNCIVKIFLSLRRFCKTKNGETHGILEKMSVENRIELLRRVNVVLTDECVESRVLALVLFGCWAYVAKDVALLRYAVLSSLNSVHVLEVKASLFAGGCFSEVSDDFGSVFLERLANIMTSPKSSLSLKIVGARAFSKIHCSSLITMKSYKVGAELVRKISEEEILVALLISLSKLSTKACFLVSEQVLLLSSFIAQKTSLHMQAIVLRCMRYIGERAACLVPVNDFPFQALFKLFYEPNVPSAMRCDILRILLQIVAYGLPGVPITNEFMKFMSCVEDSIRSSFLSERLSAREVLIYVSNKLKGRYEIMFENNSTAYFSRVVSGLVHQITQLSLVSSDTEKTELKQELRSILDLLLVLVENNSEMGCFILDKLYFVIESIVNSSTMSADASAHKMVNVRAQENNSSVRKFMFYIYRFLDAFLAIKAENLGATDQVVCKLERMVSFVCESSLFDCSVHTYYALLLHSRTKFGCLYENMDIGNSVKVDNKSPGGFLGSGVLIHKCVGNMVAGGDTWYAYKAGIYALSEGLPSVANSILQLLETRVQSNFCCQWLKFLIRFSHSGKNIQLLLQQACHAWPCGHVLRLHMDNGGRDMNVGGCIGKLVDACDDISASDKMLEAISVQAQTLCFQRWYIALRVKIVLVLVDMLKLLDTCLHCKDNVESMSLIGVSDLSDDCPFTQKVKDIMPCLVGISSKLTRLAQECDLVSSSFMDMDSKSLKDMSTVAFGCSLLALCAEFVNSTVDSLLSNNPIERSSDFIHCQVLVRDLAGRLWLSDSETCADLMSLLRKHEVHESHLPLLPRFLISKAGILEELCAICRCSVKEIIELQNKLSNIHNNGAIVEIFSESAQILLNVLVAWMQMPLRIPKYFFKVRPTIGSVLICSNAGSEKRNELSITLGSHLALNLCIQLKNMPSDICSSLSTIYCILRCKTSFMITQPNAGVSKPEMTGYDASRTEMMIDLNKKLQSNVMKQMSEFMRWRDCHDDGEVEACVCFEMDGRGQGFSTCLLNVSAFPVGYYQVEWHSGGVDSEGKYWSFLPLSPGPLFSVKHSNSS